MISDGETKSWTSNFFVSCWIFRSKKSQPVAVFHFDEMRPFPKTTAANFFMQASKNTFRSFQARIFNQICHNDRLLHLCQASYLTKKNHDEAQLRLKTLCFASSPSLVCCHTAGGWRPISPSGSGLRSSTLLHFFRGRGWRKTQASGRSKSTL